MRRLPHEYNPRPPYDQDPERRWCAFVPRGGTVFVARVRFERIADTAAHFLPKGGEVRVFASHASLIAAIRAEGKVDRR
jgi:hypothetical protein